jgi:hypothetical protein
MAPDLRRKVDAARAARLAREVEMKKQADAQVSLGSFRSVVYFLKKALCFFLFVCFFFDLIETITSWLRDPLLVKLYFFRLG